MEGAKSVEELLASDFETSLIIVTDALARTWEVRLSKCKAEIILASEDELTSLGAFQTNTGALAVAKMKSAKRPTIKPGDFALTLDDIRDPGNLGTIIRTADWYGIKEIIASKETADFYNPKVISATMGSFCRMNVFYTDLPEYLSQNKLPVYGTFLDGENIHTEAFQHSGLIVIGNEANGISRDVEKFVTHRITIPKFGAAESLNAGIATAVVLDNLRRLKE